MGRMYLSINLCRKMRVKYGEIKIPNHTVEAHLIIPYARRETEMCAVSLKSHVRKTPSAIYLNPFLKYSIHIFHWRYFMQMIIFFNQRLSEFSPTYFLPASRRHKMQMIRVLFRCRSWDLLWKLRAPLVPKIRTTSCLYFFIYCPITQI